MAEMLFHRSPPMPPMLAIRPVDPEWVCQRSGDCCRAVEAVTMTVQEQTAVMDYAYKTLTIGQLNQVNFSINPRPGFVDLHAGPCPFLSGQNVCLVHSVRPYNCRRFGCLRPDVQAEPLQMAPLSAFVKYGTIGCSNLRMRLVQSRVARRIYVLLQRKGQRWARTHGWKEPELP